MFKIIFLALVFFGINLSIFKFFKRRYSWFSTKKMIFLYIYHLFFYGVYSWYANNNPSDSKGYWKDLNVHSGSWFELFGTDTTFINFVSYPFFRLGFNYDMLMITFAWLGYLGFLYSYIFFRTNIPIKIVVFKKINFLTLILFFPNMHFWTASLGKGALIFMGLMMFAYAISNPKGRIYLLILSSIIIFYIRPHIFMFVAVGAVIGYMSGKTKIPLWKKFFISVSLLGFLVTMQDQILGVMGLQGSEDLIEDFGIASETRSEDLRRAGSAVDMSSYPLLLKLLTFWFRPLFFDATNFLSIIISFENLIYLLLFIKIIKKDFIKFILASPSLVKMSITIFLLTSFAMTFVMSNLGIIMRQKSMVMYFLFFVIYYYLAQKKYNRIIRLRKLRAQRIKEMKVAV